MPLTWATAAWPVWVFALVTAAVTALGVWAANRADAHWGTHDSGRIVIDEVAGYMTAMVAVDRGDWVLLALAFVLFRAFDIAKPPPIRAIDRRMPGGLGVMLDDTAAGVMAGAVLLALSHSPVPGHLRALV